MPSSVSSPFAVDVHLGPDDLAASLRRDARAGLTAAPKELSPTWLYDERGCELFEAITRLPEYYPTRTERTILTQHAGAIAALIGADTLVELGSGTSEKTRIILDAMTAAGQLRRFVAFDVAEVTLRAAADAIATEYPGLDVVGVVGDFRQHLEVLPPDGRRLIAFLGGTIGNLEPKVRADFLARLATVMTPGDALLLGTDLVKDRARLVAAYDDAAGVTAAFNKNVLTVINRELGADFDPDRFDHVAHFDDAKSWIEMRLRSRGRQRVRIAALDLTVEFADGEDIRTEISAKFRRGGVGDELAAAGLRLIEWWTDHNDDYALSLSVR